MPGQPWSVRKLNEHTAKCSIRIGPETHQQNLTKTHGPPGRHPHGARRGSRGGPARFLVTAVPTLHPRGVGWVRNPTGERTVLLMHPVVAKRKQSTESQQRNAAHHETAGCPQRVQTRHRMYILFFPRDYHRCSVLSILSSELLPVHFTVRQACSHPQSGPVYKDPSVRFPPYLPALLSQGTL